MSDRQLIADLLSALEYHTEQTRPIEFSKVAIEAAREHLRKPEQPAQQEPVAWCVLEPWLSGKFEPQDCFSDVELDANVGWVPLYTSPQTPAQPWVELTDAEIDECEGLANIRYRKHTASVQGQHLSPADGFLWHCARAIEAKLKEKNT